MWTKRELTASPFIHLDVQSIPEVSADAFPVLCIFPATFTDGVVEPEI